MPLTTSTIVFAVALAVVFAVWYAVERTLSIHTIVTTRREAFYWLAILFTFALGTAAGDLVAEKLDLGFGVSSADLRRRHRADHARALRASAQRRAGVLAGLHPDPAARRLDRRLAVAASHKDGGLGLGTTGTSYIFLGCILALVVFLSLTRQDVTEVRRVRHCVDLTSPRSLRIFIAAR